MGQGEALFPEGVRRRVPPLRQAVVQRHLHGQRLQPEAERLCEALLERKRGVAGLPEPPQVLFPGEPRGAYAGEEYHRGGENGLGGRFPAMRPLGSGRLAASLRVPRECAPAFVEGQQHRGHQQERRCHAGQDPQACRQAEVPQPREGGQGAGQEDQGRGRHGGRHAWACGEERGPQREGLVVPVAAEYQYPHVVADAQKHGPEGRRH